MRIALLSLFLCFRLSAATWYVDNAATGANTGRSWTDAWTNTLAIVWGSIAAGDTVYFDGGLSYASKNYSTLEPNKSGTQANPITFRCSQEDGRNGLVVFSQYKASKATNIVVNGAKSDSFTVPTSVADLRQITNNIGIRFARSSAGAVNAPVFAAGTPGFQYQTLKWLDIVDTSQAVSPIINHCVYLNGVGIRGSTIEYCWLRNAVRSCVNGTVASGQYDPTSWTNLVIHHSILERFVADGVYFNAPGVTLHHNILGPRRTDYSADHDDSIQLTSLTKAYLRVYNNLIFDDRHSLSFLTLAGVNGGNPATGFLQYYGNVFYISLGWPERGQMNYFVQHSAWGVSGPVTNAVYTNIYVLNNTFYRSPIFAYLLKKRDVNVGQELWSAIVTNAVIKNNLALDCGKNETGSIYQTGLLGLEGPGWLDPASTNGMFYTTNEVQMDYNVVSGPSTKMTYGGTLNSAADFATRAPTFSHNSNARPSLVNTNASDFRLSETDTACRDLGQNLSSLESERDMPGIGVDLWGVARGYNGAWDIGASEFLPTNSVTPVGDTNLLLQIKFEDFLGDGQADDSSGYGNHALRFGYCYFPSNFPVNVNVTNNGTPSIGGQFRYYWDNYATYGRSGDYMAVTNLNAGSLTQATIMVWAKYDAAYDSAGNPGSWTLDHNSTLLDNGRYQTAGSWRLGRQNYYTGASGNNKTQLTFWTNTTSSGYVQPNFGDSGDANGATAAMVHYAWVFDRGTNTLYRNGLLVSQTTCTQTAIQMNTQSHWLGIGGWPHHGSISRDPWLTTDDCPEFDEYPNTFWFNGKMDDVRIYRRCLTASEIAGIASVTGVAPVIGSSTASTATATVGDSVWWGVLLSSGTYPANFHLARSGTTVFQTNYASAPGWVYYTNSAVALTNAGTYVWTIANDYGQATSTGLVLTVNPAEEPIPPPEDGTVTIQGQATITGDAVIQ